MFVDRLHERLEVAWVHVRVHAVAQVCYVSLGSKLLDHFFDYFRYLILEINISEMNDNDNFAYFQWYGGEIQLPLKKLPDSSVSSLIQAGRC